MSGIATFWKKSRISKIIAVILPFPLLLVALMLSPVEVFASSGQADFSLTEITVTDGGITSSGRLTPKYITDSGKNILMHLVPYIPSPGSVVFDPSTVDGSIFIVYSGVVSISHLYTFSTTADVTVYHEGYITGFVSDNIVITASIDYQSMTDIDRMSVVSYSTSCNNNGNCNPRIGSINHNSATIWDMADFESNFVSNGTIRHNYEVEVEVSVQVDSDFANANNDWTNLMKTFITPTVSTTYNTCNLYGSAYNLREIYQGFDAKLYNIWVNSNLIYNTLVTANQKLDTINDNNTLGYNRIVNAINALDLSNSADVERIIDLMQNNNSGVAEVSDTVRQQLESANASADLAVDDAVHDYDTEFNKVKQADTEGFFINQNSAVTFWRDLGEWILNSNNIGFMATGLIICTLITVFVFLLRL